MSPQANPLISVIIPAYNAEQFIAEALSSIKAQNYAPIEILVVDDGSRDNTSRVVSETAPDARLIVQKNAGASAARNTGMRQARGDFICFLDADDGWFPGKLRAQVDYLATHPEVGVVYHKWLVWKPEADGSFRVPVIPSMPPAESIDAENSGWLYCQLLLDSIVHTSTVMFRRSVLDEIGFFDTKLQTGEDYDYWLRVSRICQIHKLAGTYSFYRAAPGSLTSSPKKENNEYNVVSNAVKRWGLTGPDNSTQSPSRIRQRLFKLAFDFAYLHYHHGSVRIALFWFGRSLHHRMSLKSLAYVIVSALRSVIIKQN